MGNEVHDWYSIADEHAVKMREFYDAFMRAGFTTDEAFKLTQNIQQSSLVASMGRGMLGG